MLLFVNCTDASGGGSLVVTIQGQDGLNATAYTVLASAAITTAVLNVYRVSPQLTAVGNSIAKDIAPHDININVVLSTNPLKFSISACFMP